ncbi:hypothetical protein FB480_10485 [Agrobacterium vitis]|nr:hypothetical protein FB480_10485 [Agrobacterium vitis]
MLSFSFDIAVPNALADDAGVLGSDPCMAFSLLSKTTAKTTTKTV